MKDEANIHFNPLKIFVISLSFSYLIGEIFDINMRLTLLINIIGLFLLIVFFVSFFICARIFFLHNEQLPPSTPTEKIIKSGIYSYTRNPIYISFVGFQISMFLLFGNIIYLLSSLLLFLWIHFFVVLREETYLFNKFGQEYEKYKSTVPRWIFF
mgnify:CR=1 FL=1